MPGTVVISVDAELGWGFHDYPSPPMARIEAARSGWNQLLELFECFQIPASWAVVGHLFLDSCDGVHRGHPLAPEWFSRERTLWKDRPEFRYGGGLITNLVRSPVPHDIGCHTFSHVVLDESAVDQAVVEAELNAALKAGQSHDISYDSFIFPRNHIGFRELLVDAGFITYRGVRPEVEMGHKPTISKSLELLDADRIRIVEPVVDEYGLVELPPSMYLFGVEGILRSIFETIWTDPIVVRAKNGIDRAIEESGIFHMWLHPNNLVTDRDVRRVRTILAYIAGRSETELSVKTMAEVAHQTVS